MSLNIAWVSPQRVLVAADSAIAGSVRGYSHNKLFTYPAQLSVMCGTGLASFVLGVHAGLTSVSGGGIEDYFDAVGAHIQAACAFALGQWRAEGHSEALLKANEFQSVFVAGWSPNAQQFLARSYMASIFEGKADGGPVRGNYARPWDDSFARPAPMTSLEALWAVACLQKGIMQKMIRNPDSPLFGVEESAGGRLIVVEMRPDEMRVSRYRQLEYRSASA